MNKRRKTRPEFFVCPHCGADVPRDALACRACGSDDETGWAEDADVWRAGIPAGYGRDEDFDDDEFPDDDFPGHHPSSPWRTLKAWAWVVVVVLLCLAMLRAVIVF